MSVICKFKVDGVTLQRYSEDTYCVDMSTVYDPDAKYSEENARFTKYTPWGNLRFGCENPKALEQLIPGEEYFVTIEKCDK